MPATPSLASVCLPEGQASEAGVPAIPGFAVPAFAVLTLNIGVWYRAGLLGEVARAAVDHPRASKWAGWVAHLLAPLISAELGSQQRGRYLAQQALFTAAGQLLCSTPHIHPSPFSILRSKLTASHTALGPLQPARPDLHAQQTRCSISKEMLDGRSYPGKAAEQCCNSLGILHGVGGFRLRHAAWCCRGL